MNIVNVKDCYSMLFYAGVCPFGFALPEAQLSTTAAMTAALMSRHIRSRDEAINRFNLLVGDRIPFHTQTALHTGYVANTILERAFLLRCYRPGGWNPTVRVTGCEHIDHALAAGRGAIFWVVPLTFSSLVTKIAIAREGYMVRHLSRYYHGGTDTAFGEVLLNPIRTRVECRYLAERIVIDRNGMVGDARPIDVLSSHLNENKIVSIMVGNAGRRKENISFLDGQICLATGPGYLALKSSAPILPVFTVRHNSGEFLTTVGPELRVTPNTNRKSQIEAMLANFSAHVEDYFLKWPDQFPWPFLPPP